MKNIMFRLRPGDTIYVPVRGPLGVFGVRHAVLVTGQGWGVEHAGKSGGAIRRVRLVDVIGDGSYRVRRHPGDAEDRHETVQWALSQVGRRDYNLLGDNNCEGFVNEATFGRRVSLQARRFNEFVEGAAKVAAVVTISVLAARLVEGLGKSSVGMRRFV